MNAVKWMMAASLLASGSVVAHDEIFDYQGQAMTGFGGPETFTAQIVYYGPINNPATTTDISFSFSGAYSQSYSVGRCSINGCEDPSEPFIVQINEKHGKFVSADFNLLGDFPVAPGSLDDGTWIIGSTGDSISLGVLSTGADLISVSNSTPGVWKEVRVNRAPELNANGTLAAMTLLAGCLLVSKRRHG